jgi:hypothetical protein
MAGPKKTADDLRTHALKRLVRRYGVHSRADILAMEEQIREQRDVKLLFRESAIRTRWRILYRGETYYAIYDSKRSAMATFLPWHAAHTSEREDAE